MELGGDLLKACSIDVAQSRSSEQLAFSPPAREGLVPCNLTGQPARAEHCGDKRGQGF